jgi:hypothetical protein
VDLQHVEPPHDLEPRSPTPDDIEPDSDDASDLSPRQPILTADPLQSRLVPGELAVLAVVAAILIVAGWIALEFVGMVSAPAPSASPGAASPAASLVAGSPPPSGRSPAPSGSIAPSGSPPATETPSSSFPVVPLASGEPVAGAWRRIAAPPIGGRTNAAAAWSGTEMLVWGGFNGTARWGDGAAFNPSTNKWRRLPKSPMTARMAPAAAWTGTELLVWGGYQVRFASDGAAYNPATNRWRALPAAPLEPGPPSGAWTGTRFVVVTGTPGAAVYDPEANTWEALPPPPLDPGAIEVVSVDGRVFAIRQPIDPGERLSIAELLVAGGSWLRLEDGPAAPDGVARPAIVAGPAILVGGAAFGTEDARWATLDLGSCPFQPDAAAASRASLVLSTVGAIDLAAGACRTVGRVPNRPGGGSRVSPTSIWTGRDFIVWSGGGGEPGATFAKDGVAFRPSP